MKLFSAAFFMIFALNAGATVQTFAIGDMAVMQSRADGNYDVICKNGNRETVTDLDLKLGNACPNLTESEPTEILSLQFREDGSFDVVCRDMTKKVATAEEIMAGRVCAPVPPPPPEFDLADGYYVVSSGNTSWCDQEVTANHDDQGVLTSLVIHHTNGCSVTYTYECEGAICTYDSYRVEILNGTSYQFSYSNGTNAGVFTLR